MTVEIKYIGFSGFELTSDKGIKILIDPFITENPTTSIKVDDIEETDIVLLSHGLCDHGFDDGIAIAKKTGATLVCTLDLAHYAVEKYGLDRSKIKFSAWGATYEIKGIKIRAVPAMHGSTVTYNDKYISYLAAGLMIYTESDNRI
jgi:L-ascorbate metabolism protein UlaG (beta-lactamase superfamily)